MLTRYTTAAQISLPSSWTVMRKICVRLFTYFISAVLDYAVWDEREKSQMQLEFIYSALSERLAAEKVLH